LAQETVYWRRSVWEKIGGLDETLRFCMDYDYWLRMDTAGYQIHLLPAYLGAFRQHDDAKSYTIRDIYRQELSQLYQRSGVGSTEEEVTAKMGQFWQWRYDLIKDLCHKSIFNNPQQALWIMRYLHIPLLSWP